MLPYQALAPPGLRRGHDSPPRPPRPCTAVLDFVRGFQNLTVILNLFQFVKYSLKMIKIDSTVGLTVFTLPVTVDTKYTDWRTYDTETKTFSKSTSLVFGLSIAVWMAKFNDIFSEKVKILDPTILTERGAILIASMMDNIQLTVKIYVDSLVIFLGRKHYYLVSFIFLKCLLANLFRR